MPAPIKKGYSGVQRLSLAICLVVLLAAGCSNSSGSDKPSGDTGSGVVDASSNAPGAKKVETSNGGITNKTSSKSTKADTAKSPEKAPKKIVVSTEPDINEPEFHKVLLAATNDYLQFGMVNSIALAAPQDCEPPGAPQPLMSESEHESSHGNKLYFLFAKEIGHYVNPENKPAPLGQVIVKAQFGQSRIRKPNQSSSQSRQQAA